MGLIGNLLVNVFALFVVSYIIPGFVINDFTTAIVVAVVFGVINTFVKPLLKIITLPLTFLTLGLSAFLINVLLLLFVAYIVPGFEIANFLTAVYASLLLSITNAFLGRLTK